MIKKLFFSLLFLPAIVWAQHQVSGKFLPADAYEYVFLYESTPKGHNYVDRSEVAPDGSFNIIFREEHKAGVYKLVYALPPEENNFDIIYNGNENIALVFNSETGASFSASKENKLWESYTNSMATANSTISNFYNEKSTDTTAFNTICNTLRDAQKAFETASEGTLAHQFIKANKPYVPEQFEDLQTYSTHFKNHYLDAVDFNGTLLQSSDFLKMKVNDFVFAFVNDEAGYKAQVDALAEKIGDNNEVKTAFLERVWQEFVSRENESMANYITDAYLLTLAKQAQNTNLKTMLTVYKNTSIGAQVPNFDLTVDNKPTKLHELNSADRYLLIFWSSTCGHCLDELPKAQDILKVHSDIKIIAIGLEDDQENWLHTIPQFKGFDHVLGLQKWDNPIAKAYGVNATPSYYVLDKDKRLVAKPQDVEVLEKILD